MIQSLKKPSEIQFLLKKGKRFYSEHFHYYYLQGAEPMHFVIAIRRTIDNAVKRNRTRRQIKEWLRLNTAVSGQLMMVQKKKFETLKDRSQLLTEFKQVLQKMMP